LTDQNLFDNGNNKTEGGNPTQPQTDIFADKLNNIRNEDGKPKFNSTEQALESIPHSQEFIKTLKSEKQEIEDELQKLRVELDKRDSVEEAMRKLTENQPNQAESITPQVNTGLDEDKVRELLADALGQDNARKVSDQNLLSVQANLIEKFGDKAQEVIQAKAVELNTTPAELEKLARTNPAMAMGLLGNADVQKTAQPTTPSQTTSHTVSSRELPSVNHDKKLITGGATSTEIADEWAAIKADVYSKLDVQT